MKFGTYEITPPPSVIGLITFNKTCEGGHRLPAPVHETGQLYPSPEEQIHELNRFHVQMAYHI